MLGRHARLAGLRLIEEKVAEVVAPTLGGLKAKKTRELGGAPDANVPKIVAFPAT